MPRCLLSPLDLTVEELDELMDTAMDIMKDPEKYSHTMDGKVLATLFFEPSTRTRLSFEETVADTIRVMSQFADICAMRHPKEGAALVAAEKSDIPIINAGDGGHQHPTQTLTDLMTIKALKGHFDNLTVGMCGDLKFGRTVHSLIRALVRYENVKFIFISPKELMLPGYIRDDLLIRNNVEFREVTKLEDVLSELDLLYMTRVQRERFFNEEDYVRLKDFYILDRKKMELAGKDMLVLHPLPRVNEIATEIDDDPRAAYFKQVRYGMFIRMALILKLLDVKVK